MGKLRANMATFMNANGTVCERDRMPTRVVIPADVPYFAMPGRTDDAALAACCHPNPLRLVDGCYVWCELPPQLYANRSDDPRESSLGPAFASCLVANGDPRPEVYRLRLKSAGAVAGPRAAIWLLLLLLGSLLYL